MFSKNNTPNFSIKTNTYLIDPDKEVNGYDVSMDEIVFFSKDKCFSLDVEENIQELREDFEYLYTTAVSGCIAITARGKDEYGNAVMALCHWTNNEKIDATLDIMSEEMIKLGAIPHLIEFSFFGSKPSESVTQNEIRKFSDKYKFRNIQFNLTPDVTKEDELQNLESYINVYMKLNKTIIDIINPKLQLQTEMTPKMFSR